MDLMVCLDCDGLRSTTALHDDFRECLQLHHLGRFVTSLLCVSMNLKRLVKVLLASHLLSILVADKGLLGLSHSDFVLLVASLDNIEHSCQLSVFKLRDLGCNLAGTFV